MSLRPDEPRDTPLDDTVSRDAIEGRRLGPYEVGAWIGAGGMGDVYTARDVRLDRTVAIKVVRAYAREDSQARERFDREARAVAALNHPHICTLHDVGHEDGVDFLVMEHLRGETLASRLSRGPLAIGEALDLAIQIASALEHAHAAGIVHRDLKPGNIFIVRGHGSSAVATAKLLDFGLAKKDVRVRAPAIAPMSTASGLTTPGMILGSVQYMAPEQIEGKAIDARTDIFSFGVVLFEMLTGRKAFSGDSQARVMAAILDREPAALTTLVAGAPVALEALIRTCMAKKPDERWQHSTDLVRELRTIAADVQESSGTRLARRPRPVSKIMLATVGGAVIVAAAAWLAHRSREGRPAAELRPVFTQLTFTGHARGGVISPRGDTFAYIDDAGSAERVQVQDLSGGAPVTVFSADTINDVRWSPPGNEVAILSRSGSSGPVLEIVPRLGGSRRAVGSGPVAWSPDGSRVVTGWNAAQSGSVRIVVANLDGLSAAMTRAPEIPALRNAFLRAVDWAPGPRPLILTAEKDLSMRAIWDLPDSAAPRKLFQAQRLAEATWSPGGAAVYVLVGDGSTATLSRVEIDERGTPTGRVRDLLLGFVGDSLDVSPDGRRLMFTRRDQHATLEMRTLDAKSGTNDRALTTGTARDLAPRYSPDGRTVAFVRDLGNATPNLFVVDAGGGTPRQITFLDGRVISSAFSPDGQTIAFTFRQRDGSAKLGTVPVSGGQPTWFDVAGAQVAWAPGDNILVQSAGNRNFEVVNPATREHHALFTNASGFVAAPTPFPDHRRIALVWNRQNPGIWIVSLDNPAEQRLLTPDGMPMGFSADGASLFAWLPARRQVVRIRVADGTSAVMADVPVEEPFQLLGDVTPDGRRFVFARVQTSKDIWIVENFDSFLPR